MRDGPSPLPPVRRTFGLSRFRAIRWSSLPWALAMDFAPLASALNAMLSGLPFASADHQMVQRPIGTPPRDMGCRRRLSAVHGSIVWHRPVQGCQLRQAGHHPGGLPERKLEQDLDRQAEPDRGVAEDRGATGAAVRRRKPCHLHLEPDQQRPTVPSCGGRYSRTSSWCDSGQVMACSCDLSDSLDSPCESSDVRIVLQCPALLSERSNPV